MVTLKLNWLEGKNKDKYLITSAIRGNITTDSIDKQKIQGHMRIILGQHIW